MKHNELWMKYVNKTYYHLKRNMLTLSCWIVCSFWILCILTSVWWCPMGLFTWVQCKHCLTLKCKDAASVQCATETTNCVAFSSILFFFFSRKYAFSILNAVWFAFSIQVLYLKIIREKKLFEMHSKMRFLCLRNIFISSIVVDVVYVVVAQLQCTLFSQFK